MPTPDGIVSEQPLAGGTVSEQVVAPVSDAPPASVDTPSSVSNAPQGTDEARRLQSLADQRLAQMYQAQQRAEALERQMQEVLQRVQPQQAQNPHDPATNFVQWQRWENAQLVRQVAEEARKSSREELQGMVQQAQEIQWQSAHPQADINQVKMWARMNGVSNLDHAWTLMNLNQNIQNVTQQVSNQALNQFRNPQQGAIPVRGAEASGVKPSVSFAETLKAYHANPSIANGWTPEFRADFERELRVRYNQG